VVAGVDYTVAGGRHGFVRGAPSQGNISASFYVSCASNALACVGWEYVGNPQANCVASFARGVVVHCGVCLWTAHYGRALDAPRATVAFTACQERQYLYFVMRNGGLTIGSSDRESHLR
jgi:hypothetical protein